MTVLIITAINRMSAADSMEKKVSYACKSEIYRALLTPPKCTPLIETIAFLKGEDWQYTTRMEISNTIVT